MDQDFQTKTHNTRSSTYHSSHEEGNGKYRNVPNQKMQIQGFGDNEQNDNDDRDSDGIPQSLKKKINGNKHYSETIQDSQNIQGQKGLHTLPKKTNNNLPPRAEPLLAKSPLNYKQGNQNNRQSRQVEEFEDETDWKMGNNRDEQDDNEEEEEEENNNRKNIKYSAQNYYKQPQERKRQTNSFHQQTNEKESDEEPQEKSRAVQGAIQKQNNRMMQRQQKIEEGLHVCPEGCGRTFNEFALEKHVKVCKKVFQDKRTIFESTQMRDIKSPGEQVISADEERRQEIIRRNKQNHECPDCGRSFRYEVYEKHIKICLRVFTKKHRESSLQRKTSINTQNQTNVNQAPSKLLTPLTKKALSQNEADPLNKKPPLKKNALAKELPLGKLESVKQKEETGLGYKHAWDDIPVGLAGKQQGTNQLAELKMKKKPWEEEKQIGMKLPKSSGASSQWDEYPSQEQISTTTATTMYSRNGKSQTSSSVREKSLKKMKGKAPWSDDWNSEMNENCQEEVDNFKINKVNEQSLNNTKNYNFNKQVKNSTVKLSSNDVQSGSGIDSNDCLEDDYSNQEDRYIYSKPNIGKKTILSAKKTAPLSKEYQKTSHPMVRREQECFSEMPSSSASNNMRNREQYESQMDTSSQYSKPFLKKNQGNQVVSKAKKQGNNDNNQIINENKRDFNCLEDIPLNNNHNNEFSRQPNDGPPEGEFELIECPEGCGRKFKEAALKIHMKICKKVFQQKRKVFDSALNRQIEEQVQIQSTAPPPKRNNSKQIAPSNKKQVEQNQQPSNQYGSKMNSNQENTQIGKKKPSWKLQSEAFRAVMRQANGSAPPNEKDDAIIKEAFQRDDYVQCDYCGRKFNDKVAERHIPFCKTKNQINQIKQTGKPKLGTTLTKQTAPQARRY